jgi:putative oxidoreductase
MKRSVTQRARLREWFLGGAGGGSATADAGLLLVRVFAGLSLALAHGIGKLPPSERFIAGVEEMGFALPVLFGWAAALSEFGGGLLLTIGLLTRPAALFVLVTMLVAAFIRNAGAPFGERELALLYGVMALLFLLAGAGRYSLDAQLRRTADPG